jgi:hypothetical protein
MLIRRSPVTSSRFRITVLSVTFAALLALPALADAQGRRAVRVVRSRPAVRVGVGVFYAPSIRYRPWYASPYGWYDPFYSYPPFYSQWYPPYYGGGYYGQGYYGRGYYDLSSSLRLQVSPKEAEVFIDGYYAGTVDNFDGVFQRLHLEPGDHDLELFLPGHRSFTQKIYLQPVSTFRVRHTMEPLGAGESEPARPVATPPSSGASSQAGPAGPERAERPSARGPQRPTPRARERAQSVESDFGSIALRVQPGDATVTIDGERWEGAQDQDRLVVQLGAGTHNVEIRKDGYRTYITDITVRPGETTPLNVSLARQ